MKVNKKLLKVMSMAAAFGVGVTAISAQTPEPKFKPIQAYERINKNREGMIKYKINNKDKLRELTEETLPKEEIFVTVTFSKPLNKNQVARLIDEHNLKVHYVHARAKQENGLRVTISSRSTPDNRIINDAILSQSLQQNNAKFKGFIELVANVPSKNLQELANEKFVFLVDPSADEALVSNPTNDYMPGVFWKLENNNMVAE